MIAHQSVCCARPQPEPSDRGAQFRALAAGSGSAPQRLGDSTERQIARSRSNQPDSADAQEEPPLSDVGRQHSRDENLSLSSDGLGGAPVSSLLASVLVEAYRTARAGSVP